MVVGDGTSGQMMEPVLFRDEEIIEKYDKPWAVTGKKERSTHNTVQSIYIQPEILEDLNNRLQKKYREIERREVMVEVFNCEDSEIIITAFGTCARIAKNVIKQAAEIGIKVGLIRPITLWPFPERAISAACERDGLKAFLDLELNAGQMVEDVRLAVNGRKPVEFYGRTGGMIPSQMEVLQKIREIVGR